jgi:hypothetical protein
MKNGSKPVKASTQNRNNALYGIKIKQSDMSYELKLDIAHKLR